MNNNQTESTLKIQGYNLSETQTKKYYETLQAQQFLPGMKIKLPQTCAFTLQYLNTPIRSINCRQFECIYEEQTIKTLLQWGCENNKEIHCLICNQKIEKNQLFQDVLIQKTLQFRGKAEQNDPNRNYKKSMPYLNAKNEIITREGKSFFTADVQKLAQNNIDEIERQNKQILEKNLKMTLWKQKLEMLKFLQSQQIHPLNKFAQDQYEQIKQKYSINERHQNKNY